MTMENYTSVSLENYRQREIKVRGLAVNILGFAILLVLMPLFGFIFYQVWGSLGSLSALDMRLEMPSISQMVYIIYSSLLGIFIIFAVLLTYEIITGIYWSKYTEVKLKVTYGASCFRFCHCKEVIKIKPYIVGKIIPVIIIGVIPSIAGIIFGYIFVSMFGVLFIANGTDAFLTMYQLRKEGKNSWVRDMDTTIGYIVYSPSE